MTTCIFKKHNFDVKFFDALLIAQQNCTANDIAQALDIAKTHAASKLRILVKFGFVDRLTLGVTNYAAIYRISKTGRLLLQELRNNTL